MMSARMDVTNKNLSRDLNYIVDEVMCGYKILQQFGKRIKTKSENVLWANFYVCRMR